jgi:hypothetical protein
MVSLFHSEVKGIWCEKPYMAGATRCPTQVNYIRRFDARHQLFAKKPLENAELIVMGRPDLTTVCHFVDLAAFWGISLERLRWNAVQGGCSYLLRFDEPHSGHPGARVGHEVYFPDGGVAGAFMKNALSNLLDVVEGKPGAKLLSPADPGITQRTRDYLARLGPPGNG